VAPRQIIAYAVDDQGRLSVDIRMNPVIVTVCWGQEAYFESLGLWLDALRRFGRFGGPVVVFSDRDLEATLRHAPAATRGEVRCLPIMDRPWLQRYRLGGDALADHSPVLYIDADIVVDADIAPTLARIAASHGLCVTTEREIQPALGADSVGRLPLETALANHFGLRLLKADEACRDDLVPVINSGVIGFSQHDLAFSVGSMLAELYASPHHQETVRFSDQPFLNYVLSKARVADTESLLGTCQFVARWTDQPFGPRGFMHFIWARGDKKPRHMRAYVEALDAAYGKGVETHRFVRLPIVSVPVAAQRRKAVAQVKAATDMVVQAGPFAGLRLSPRQPKGASDDIASQLLGVYEQELHATIARLARRDYERIVNVGCAAGLYAVGLARLFPGAPVTAFDTSEEAQIACRETAELNGVTDRVAVDGTCLPQTLADLCGGPGSSLVVLDCEGYERELLSSDVVCEALRRSDLIIDAYEIVDRRITSDILERYAPSHRISVVGAGGRDPNAFPCLASFDDMTRWAVICENRPQPARWLVLEHEGGAAAKRDQASTDTSSQ
jgi:hypothetical protein